MDDFVPLARLPDEPSAAWGQRLIEDLTARHRRRVRAPVETYLARLPGLEAEGEVVCDLVVAEWVLRRQDGEIVELTEYLSRFPAWGDELSVLWHVDQRTSGSAEELPGDPPEAAAGADRLSGTVAFPVVFGPYRLVREFEGGGMGRVFLAEPSPRGAAVALKVPRLPRGPGIKAVAEHATRLQRFVREATLTKRLNHPSLCRALDIGANDGLPYFTMPYYPNGSVASELQDRGPFDPDRAARLVADVARALQHAHDLGIVHRDLKPSNLLKDGRGQIVVTDFGLAVPLDTEELRLTGVGLTPGTPLYFSPEQARGERDLSPASDVFSLGVVLYELLSGQPPFAAEGALQLLLAIEEAAPPSLEQVRPDVPPALVVMCRRAMARDPGARYCSMTEFADDLERFLSGTWQPPTKTPQSLLSDTGELVAPPLNRPRRRWLGRAVGLAIVAASVGIVWGVLGSGPPESLKDERQGPHPGVERPVVSTRKPVGLRGQLQTVHDDLGRTEAVARRYVRYFTLTAVHDNPYVSDADWNLHLGALHRVLNRLSHNKDKVTITPVDVAGCVLRIDLRDLGWDAENEWADLLKVEPYGVRYDAGHNDETLRRLALELCDLTASLDAPYVRADWFVVAATRAPLFGHLQQLVGTERRTPPFDMGQGDEPLGRVVRLYQEHPIDARVAAAELGLGTVTELDARWPAVKLEMRQALDQGMPRSRWAGEDGIVLFSVYVRTLKLGVPRATQPLH